MNVESNIRQTFRPIPSDDELVARATAMIPTLRAGAFRCDALGRVPDETIAAFQEAGFFRVLQPKAYGGYEMSPLTYYRIVQEVASGCPSSGWALMVLGVHNFEVSFLDPQAARDLWEQDDTVRASSSYVPFGKAEKVEGGYRVFGQWKFSSGCDHATWVFLGAFVPRGEGQPPDMRVFLIPRGDYEIVDGTWNVFGLSGTGSKDVNVKGCFVPEYRSHSLSDHFANPGHDVGFSTYTNPYYRISFGVTFHNGIASVVAGMAKGMVAVFRDQMQAKRNSLTGEVMSGNPAVQRRIYLADAKVRQAGNLLRSVVEGCETYLQRGEEIPMDKRAQYVADAASVGELASEVSVLLFRAAGGRGVFSDNMLGLFFRNIQAGCNHVCMELDKLAVNAGGTLLGLPNQFPMS